MANIAVITARGGSKRIPRKNVKPFLGKPIMAYGIEAALAAGIFDEVMVSTEDEEIAALARSLGAAVPFMRGAKTSDDFATTADVLLEVLGEYQKSGRGFERMACIYPTAPFVTAEKLKRGMALLDESGLAMVMPVTRFSHPPQRALVVEGAELKYKWPENKNARSQDLEPFYYDCGQFYCYDIPKFLARGGQITGGIAPLIMPEDEIQDIDTETDWHMAELKYTRMAERGSGYEA